MIFEIASNDNPIARNGVVLSVMIDVMMNPIAARGRTILNTADTVIFEFFMFVSP